MVVLIKTLQVILALSILIVLHEFGHWFFARLFGIRVEKFFLFFDFGGRKLFSTRSAWFRRLFPSSEDWETEYGIGWFPLGGYCKIAGMIDESLDLEQMSGEPQPWEFRTKKAWQRLLVMAGGVLNNFIFALLAYCAIAGIWGQAYISNEGSCIYVNDLAYEMGFRNGDHIVSFDDYEPVDFGMLQADLARRDVRTATVIRGGDTVRLYIDHAMIGRVLNSELMFDLAMPFVVDSVMAGSPNEGRGLERGDVVLALDGQSTEFRQDAFRILSEARGREMEASVLRGADTLAIPVLVDTTGKIGIYLSALPNVCRETYNPVECIPAGLKLTGETISGYLKDLKLLAQPSSGAYKSVGSFIAIGQVFPSTWDWYRFLNILALLSIMLGVMNLLPIPGLDGGHILFTLFEMLTGRKPGDKFLVAAQMIGMALLLMLMLLAFGNDIGRLIH